MIKQSAKQPIYFWYKLFSGNSKAARKPNKKQHWSMHKNEKNDQIQHIDNVWFGCRVELTQWHKHTQNRWVVSTSVTVNGDDKFECMFAIKWMEWQVWVSVMGALSVNAKLF